MCLCGPAALSTPTAATFSADQPATRARDCPGHKVCERGLMWIKPSFLWMMYRCGRSTKAGQETVLAVEITRDGFEWALARVQWDPERDPRLQPLPRRSLQLGLSGEAVRRYADEWTVSLRDVTPLVREIHALVREIHALVSDGDQDSAARLLHQGGPYPVGDELPAHLQG
ncbi:DUF4291 family protein [Streptomyces pseudovenezuelae]|uniref:DUF4291 domain-containing protein n=1 Tax=Streptomyces pseudovenezuelae TaxID=67350 RepID=A0ABT6LLY4_9ACTN|nr:hypothetical protein [Streptomyces pseudovenezuelae]